MDTLLLAKSGQPIRRIDWPRAMILHATDKVEIVALHDKVIRTSPDGDVDYAPSIVRFKRSHKRKDRGVRFSRDAIYLRDGGSCQYCGKHLSRKEFTYDHVVPASMGGKTTWDNIVVACLPCNQQKANQTLEASGMRLLKKPSKPTGPLPLSEYNPLFWTPDMPDEWKTYLYWNASLHAGASSR